MKAGEKELEKAAEAPERPKDKKDVFAIEEIKIEEMAIDGICGVY